MTTRSQALLALAAACALSLLAGCGATYAPNPVESEIGNIQGMVHGGQQPVSGAHVYLFAAGIEGYAGPGLAASKFNVSKSLLTNTGNSDSIGSYVITNAGGGFSLGGHYICTASGQVYIYVLGGNSGAGTNSNLGFLSILGTCPIGGTLADTVPFVVVNEVSTVVAAYAMAGFATDPTHVSSGGSTLAATGIRNAFSTATNLVNVATGMAYATTPNGNGTVPQARLNTLGNILAACVNASDAGFANCASLFAAVPTTAGTTKAPTDTAGAAINLAHSPATATSTLYALQSATPPFAPNLSASPNDFSVSLIFKGGGLLQPQTTAAHILAVDGSGNIWSVVTANNLVTELSPLGVPLLGTGVAGSTANGISQPISVAIDTATIPNVWVVNNFGETVTELSSVDGALVGDYTLYSSGTTNALSAPSDGEFDGSGNLWISNYTSSTLVKAATTSTSATFTAIATDTTHLKSAEGVALGAGPAGSVFLGTASAKYASLYTNADAYSLSTALTRSFAFADAVDASGNVWYAESIEDIAKVVPGTTLTATEISTTQPNDYYYPSHYSIALDGAGNVFTPDASNGVINEYSNAGDNVSLSGYVPAGEPNNYMPNAAVPPSGYVRPFTIVMDGSGNAWYNTISDSTLRELVGIGVPVATPLAYGVTNSLLGTRP